MKLFYRKYGNGPPLVILHGLYGSSDNWATIAKSLSDSYTVILPDQRNHGQSPHNFIHDYESMRNDLHELAIDLKLGKFFLAGHSMGGKTAISFALRWPEMLNGLLIADISPFINENKSELAYNHHLNILRTILSIDPARIKTRDEARNILSENVSSEKITGFILKSLTRSPKTGFAWKINAGALLENLDKIMAGIDRKDLTQQITGFPVIFLQGTESDYLPDSDFPEIQKVFPAAEFVKVQGAGHWIHADKPDEVTGFIKKLKE
jgi:esterase